MPKPMHKHYPSRSCAAPVGYVLLAAGAILLFACIPGWAWLALLGVLLMAAGWLVLKMCNTWR